MKPLKKIIGGYMYRTTFILVIMIVLFLFFMQLFTEQRRAVDDSRRTLQQIGQVVEENQKELEEIEEEYYQTCLNNAELVSKILENSPEAINNMYELKRIAKSVEIDEIHIFDETGKIYAGTHPKYYGLTFDSGEQMMFFKPMINDKSLKLVQDITPNTAEEKPMQYSAVWNENKEFIVQIGMEPVNVMKVTEKNELSYIFSLFRVSPDANYYAIDCESSEIVGSSEMNTIGKKASDVGFDMKRVETDPDCFHNEINGVLSFCVFEKAGDTYIGRVVSTKTLYRRVPMTVMWITLALLALALILANAVIKHMNKYVVKEIHDVNEKLQLISEGNLEEEVDIRNSTEFNELSDYINEMVKSLVESNKRMSYLLEKTNLHIGTYEYGKKMNKVRFSGYIRDIFGMDENKAEELSSDIQLFRKFIDDIRKNPLSKQQMGTFRVNDKFIRIDETEKEGSIFGIAVDVSEQVKKVIEIEHERDIDTLTGLYNRRGLTEKLDELFADREALGQNAVVMIDADGLKQINDTYGHDKGDIYLKKIADIINNFGVKSSIASRQGGDEFVLFLYGYDSKDELMKVIEALKYIQGNSKATLEKGLTVPLLFSLGFAIAGENEDYQSLFKTADEEMYKNKTERKKMQKENKG